MPLCYRALRQYIIDLMKEEIRDRHFAKSTPIPYPNSTPILCLNPKCSSFSRIFTLNSQTQESVSPSSHFHCDGWCWPVQKLREFTTNNGSPQIRQTVDFLKNPIGSLFDVLTVLKNDWQQQIYNIFQSIRHQLNETLGKVLDHCLLKILEKWEKISKVSEGIQKLLGSNRNEPWTLKHQRIYKEQIESELEALSKIGILKIVNNQAISSQVDAIKEQISRIEWGIWEEEPNFDRIQRQLEIKGHQELQEWKFTNTNQDTNLKIQRIYSSLKLKQFSFQEDGQITLIKCGVCQKKLASNQKSKQTKRSQCLSKLLRHLCERHETEVLENLMKKGKNNYILSFDQFVREIGAMRSRTFLVIDRQNVNNENVAIPANENEIYWLEVVSKGRQNLTSGRCLVAESTGKDAADILIIIALYQIGRVLRNSKVILFTNDHYGATLQPILRSLGIHIELSVKSGKQMLMVPMNQSQQIMMVDQQ